MTRATPAHPRLSEYGRRALVESPISRMMTAFASDFRPGIDVNLGVGYVNEETIPARAVADAVRAVLQDPAKYPHALNYGGPAGSANLIDSLKRFLVRNGIGNLTREVLERRRFVIGASAVTSLLEAFAMVLERGVVITTEPMYYIYSTTLERTGHRIVTVPEDDAGIRVDRLEALATAHLDSLSFVYVVSIGNPTSRILGAERRRELLHCVQGLSKRTGRPIPLIVDNAYELLVHDPEVSMPESLASHDETGIVYELGTLSKALAPALRVGYLHGPPGPLMDAIVQRTNDIGLSAPLITQEASAYLLDTMADAHLCVVRTAYREKAQAVRSWLHAELGESIETVTGGSAGFYYYLTLRDIDTGEGSPFHRCAARTTGDPAHDGAPNDLAPRVVYLPGAFFSHPGAEDFALARRQMRISYGYASLGELEAGVRILGEAARYAAAGSASRLA